MTAARRAVLAQVARSILAWSEAGTLRVAIDKVDGAGKTTFAGPVVPKNGIPAVSGSAQFAEAAASWFPGPLVVRADRVID